MEFDFLSIQVIKSQLLFMNLQNFLLKSNSNPTKIFELEELIFFFFFSSSVMVKIETSRKKM